MLATLSSYLKDSNQNLLLFKAAIPIFLACGYYNYYQQYNHVSKAIAKANKERMWSDTKESFNFCAKIPLSTKCWLGLSIFCTALSLSALTNSFLKPDSQLISINRIGEDLPIIIASLSALLTLHILPKAVNNFFSQENRNSLKYCGRLSAYSVLATVCRTEPENYRLYYYLKFGEICYPVNATTVRSYRVERMSENKVATYHKGSNNCFAHFDNYGQKDAPSLERI